MRFTALLLLLACSIASAAETAGFPRGLPQSADYFPIAVWLQSPANAAKYKVIGINLYVALWKGPTE